MAPKTTLLEPAVFVDTTNIKNLARDLRKVAPAVARDLRKSLREVGQLIADEAKSRASYSTRIPGSIKVKTSGTSVKVVAGGETAPNAAPIENKGKGFVRHPVFEVRVSKGGGGRFYGKPENAPAPGLGRAGGIAPWTDKNSHPSYLASAADAKGEEASVLAEEAIAKAFLDGGFLMEN